MDFDISPRARELSLRLEAFMEKYVVPYNAAWHLSVLEGVYPPVFQEDLKTLAQEEGLWKARKNCKYQSWIVHTSNAYFPTVYAPMANWPSLPISRDPARWPRTLNWAGKSGHKGGAIKSRHLIKSASATTPPQFQGRFSRQDGNSLYWNGRSFVGLGRAMNV